MTTEKSKNTQKIKAPAQKKKAAESIDFEKSLEQLNALAEKMERGNLPLEASLKHFESGVTLIRQCQKALSDAEQRVQILVEQSGTDALMPFDDNDKS